MKKVTVVFEVTKEATKVIATGTTGKVETIDITGTDIEKRFATLLKKLKEFQLQNEILQAIDINNWR